MRDSLQPSRRFSEKEIGLILKRASEMQIQEPGGTVAESGGLSLAELEQVAREAGIDPAYVRRAAGEVQTAGVALEPTPFLGAPVRLEFERTVEGEVPESAYTYFVEEIQQTLGPTGAVNTLGRSFAWHSTNVQRQVSVTITPRQGRTRIRVEERLHNVAGGLFGGLLAGVGGGGHRDRDGDRNRGAERATGRGRDRSRTVVRELRVGPRPVSRHRRSSGARLAAARGCPGRAGGGGYPSSRVKENVAPRSTAPSAQTRPP